MCPKAKELNCNFVHEMSDKLQSCELFDNYDNRFYHNKSENNTWFVDIPIDYVWHYGNAKKLFYIWYRNIFVNTCFISTKLS